MGISSGKNGVKKIAEKYRVLLRAASINRPCTRTPSSGDSNSSSIGRVWSGSSLDRASLTSSWLRYMGNTLKWKDNWSMGRLYLRAWFWRVPVKKPSDNRQFNDSLFESFFMCFFVRLYCDSFSGV